MPFFLFGIIEFRGRGELLYFEGGINFLNLAVAANDEIEPVPILIIGLGNLTGTDLMRVNYPL